MTLENRELGGRNECDGSQRCKNEKREKRRRNWLSEGLDEVVDGSRKFSGRRPRYEKSRPGRDLDRSFMMTTSRTGDEALFALPSSLVDIGVTVETLVL